MGNDNRIINLFLIKIIAYQYKILFLDCYIKLNYDFVYEKHSKKEKDMGKEGDTGPRDGDQQDGHESGREGSGSRGSGTDGSGGTNGDNDNGDD